jgi:hypothetical protein
MKFRLKQKAGRHHEGGRVYKGGDTVVSDKDLVKAFPGKFIRLDGKGAAAALAAEEEAADAEENLPRAAVVGTDLDKAGKGEETGDDPEGTPAATGEDSTHGEGQEEEVATSRRSSRASSRAPSTRRKRGR